MKELILTKNKLCHVDDAAYEILAYYPWVSLKYGWRDGETSTIGGRAVLYFGIRKTIYLHRLIAGVPQCFGVKSKSGNRLDNTHENLQIYDKKGNTYKFTPFTGKSNFDGVVWNGWHGMWEAKFHKMSIGLYSNEVDAARAYNVKMKEIYPICSRTRLNCIPIMNKYLKNNGET